LLGAVDGASMPKCPKCGQPMATVLKREGGVVRSYYECPMCPLKEGQDEPAAPPCSKNDK
jgi:hypothetical protein